MRAGAHAALCLAEALELVPPSGSSASLCQGAGVSQSPFDVSPLGHESLRACGSSLRVRPLFPYRQRLVVG